MKKQKQKVVPFTIQEIDHEGVHPLVIGKIDGQECFFILDTGASRTVIDNKLAEGLPTITIEQGEPFAAGIGAEQLSVKQVEIPSLSLGEDILIKNYRVFCADLSPISSLYEGLAGVSIHGLIGSDFLKKYKATIDFDLCEIRLKELS